MKTIFLIDGFNLYHALDREQRYHRFKWLSLTRLVSAYLDPGDTLDQIYYFTALAYWNPGKVARHKIYIKAQENEGVKVLYGQFKERDKYCKLCRGTFKTHEEKQTDVKIALSLMAFALGDDGYDKAILISGDTDLTPAIQIIRQVFPQKLIGAVIPIGRRSENLKKVVSFHRKMKFVHLQNSRLNDRIELSDGTTLECPPSWK
jgi:uncharacterized LabA/DUF88 family protein